MRVWSGLFAVISGARRTGLTPRKVHLHEGGNGGIIVLGRPYIIALIIIYLRQYCIVVE